ncbi:hypothetical protein ACHAW6_014184 [Cyclotella cf. meneghiniana]
MRAPRSPSERGSSPVLPSVTRLRANIPSVNMKNVNIPNVLPRLSMSKTQRNTLDTEHLLAFDKSDSFPSAEDYAAPRTKRTPIVTSSAAAVQRAKSLATSVVNVKHIKTRILPIRSGGVHQALHELQTESRDDDMDYLLTESEDPIVFLMSDLDFEERERIIPVDRQLVVDTVDFGGFDVVGSDKRVGVDDTSGTVSVSASDASVASVGGSIASVGAGAESSKEKNDAFQLNNLVEGNSVKDYSKMYEHIAWSSCNVSSDDGSEPLVPPAKSEEDEHSIGSVRSVKEMNDAIQLNVPDDSMVRNAEYSGRISSPSYLRGVFVGNGSDGSAVMADESEPSLSEVEDFEADSNSQKEPGNVECFCDGESIDGSVSENSTEVESTPIDEPSYSTPLPRTSLAPVPTMSFSLGSPLDGRRFLISENPVVVTPLEHGDVILLGSHPAVDHSLSAGKDQGQEVLNEKTKSEESSEVITVDLQPKVMKNSRDKMGSTVDTKVSYDLPYLVEIGSEDSSSSQPAGSLLWNGMQIRNFDDEIFNENVEWCDEKADDNDFVASDDWKPNEDDTDSTCSQPFGCCAVNVDVKSAILTAAEKSMQPQETSQAKYPENNMLDAISDAESDIGSNSNGSSLLGSCYYSDDAVIHTIVRVERTESVSSEEFRVLVEQTESASSDELHGLIEQATSGSSDEVRDCFAKVDNSWIRGCSIQKCESHEGREDKDDAKDNVFCDDVPVNPLTECDDVHIDDKSDVSADLNESNRVPSVVSDNGEANYDWLNNFWTLEWFELTHGEQTEAMTEDFTDAFSAAGSDCQSFGDPLLDSGSAECSEIDTQSFVSLSRLETVAEEVTEEESEDETFHDEVTNVAKAIKDEDGNLCGGGIKQDSSVRDSVVFRTSRRTKKKYVRVRKWAVVRAKSNKQSKCSLHCVRRGLRNKNLNAIDKEYTQNPSSELDECVNKALELLAKRATASFVQLSRCDETVILNDQYSVHYGQSSAFLASLEHPNTCATPNTETVEDTVPHTISITSPVTKLSKTLPTNSLSIDSCVNNSFDHLGQLKNYLSQNAKEGKMGEDVNAQCNAATAQEINAEVNYHSIVSKSVTDEEHSYDKPIDYMTATEDQRNHDDIVYEDDYKMASLNLCFRNLDPSQLDTLTQKLYYTNTELAETLAMTQCELEVANRKVEVLTLEKDELLISMTKFQFGESSTDRLAENDIKELLQWLEEENELLQL